ncbi:carbohydrate ABC transporter permease [Enterocloster aldenensis]|uniref:carbohydrate ABC transporter permease n=1 Tax=Enterocloster aldenensis TaxID=358742 RepID=UPI004027BF96
MKHCRTKAARLFIYLIFSVFVVLNVFPLLWLLVSSFKTNKEFMADLFSLPKKLMAENYVAAWEYSGIGKYVFNSVLVTVGSVSIILVLAVMIAYVLARYRFRGRNMVYVYFLFGMLIPIHTTLVPLFTMFKSLHWLNRRFTLFLPYISFYMPFAIYILESYIRSIPVEMDEAAVMDGAGRFQILFRIIFPMAGPALATVCVMTFLNIWNDFVFPLILISSDKYKTIQLGLQNFIGPMSANYPQLMAALVISTTPVFCLYLLFQKKLITGMTAGAVKG